MHTERSPAHRRRRQLIFAALAAAASSRIVAQPAFDHSHAGWDALLRKHVRLLSDGNASRVQYAGFAEDRVALAAYLKAVSDVTPAQYSSWNKPQQFAFLANAYNALTVEKILTRYPNLKSIRDFGTVFGNPWKDRFFTLLGKQQHLDGIEHEMLREPGVFNDPRVHVAVNCASVGCPMLGSRALIPEKLDAQLDDLLARFMSDRSRNRFNAQSRTVELSRIFDWYGKDFMQGHKGFSSLEDVVARYADQLADAPADRALLRSASVPIRFLEYDWSLNDVR
ncbi:MAG: DUF547 domain-containing protein [Burkholderiaceae bacterium]